MKTITPKYGFLNRHMDGMPKKETIIQIIYDDFEGEHLLTCKWFPFNPKMYDADNMPEEGYVGTARIIKGEKHFGIGFHAWLQNDNEFIYYKIIN